MGGMIIRPIMCAFVMRAGFASAYVTKLSANPIKHQHRRLVHAASGSTITRQFRPSFQPRAVQRYLSTSGDNDSLDSSTRATPSKRDLELARNAAPSMDIPGSQTGGRKLAIVFTCNVCETRSAKQFTEQAYNHGVVIVRCPGCEKLHLIADRLGYFGSEQFDLDALLKEKGQSIRKVSDENVYEMNLEDLVGKEKMEELIKEANEKARGDPSTKGDTFQ